MTRKRYLASSLLPTVLVGGVVFSYAQAQEPQEPAKAKPKHTIKEVMHNAHMAPEGQKSLRDKVLEGNATPEEKQQLLDLFISLAENEAPKGEKQAWNDKTRAVVVSAAMIVVGRENAADALRKATTCAACHKDHKPPA